MREASIERRLVDGIRKAGGLALKFTSPGHSGVPDRIVLLPGGRVVFVELKTETGRLSPLQAAVHRQFRSYGMDVRTLRGKQEVEGFISEVQSMGLPKIRHTVDTVTPQVRAVLGYGPGEDSDHADGH